MEWLFGLAFVPILLCGLMCVGGMALAALGVRRGTARRTRDEETTENLSREHPVGATDR
jgi:hypothetical protein